MIRQETSTSQPRHRRDSMKQLLFSILLVIMLIMTVQAASAAVTYAHWQPNETATITINEGDTAAFDWYAQTNWYNLDVDVQLNDGTDTLVTYVAGLQPNNYAGGTVEVDQDDYQAPGTYTVSVWATDILGYQDTHTIELVVEGRTPEDNDLIDVEVTAEPTDGEAPLEVSFTCTAVGGDAPISYAWAFGDDTTSDEQNTTHTYTEPGAYTAMCTATDNDGDLMSELVVITVGLVNKAPEMEPIDDQYVDETTTFTYDLQVSDPDNTLDELICYDAEFMKVDTKHTKGADDIKYIPDWAVLDGCTIVGEAPAVESDEEYYVRVGVKDPEGLFDEEDFYITVRQRNQPPTIEDVADLTISEGTNITVPFTVTDADALDTLTCSVTSGTELPAWLTLEDCGLAGTAPQVNGSDTSTISITVTDDKNASDTMAFTITVVDAGNGPTADFTWSPTNPLVAEAVQFTDTSSDDGNIVSHDWTFGDGARSDQHHPTHSYASGGSYQVTLVVTDDDGLTGITQQTITVTDYDFSSITVSADPTTGTAPLDVNFTCSVIGGDAPLTYSWEFDDGTFSTDQNPTHTYHAVGTYTASCLAKDVDGDTISGPVVVYVEETTATNHPPIMQPLPDDEVYEGEHYTKQLLVSDPDDDPVTCYSAADLGYGISLPAWLSLDKDNCVLSGTAPEVTEDKVYLVEVGVEDDGGLTDSEYYYLTVKDLPANNVPPTADFAWDPAAPSVGETVTFTATATDIDGNIVLYEWDLDDDGSYELSGPTTDTVLRSYPSAGDVAVRLRVTDDDGAADSVAKIITITDVSDHDFTDIAVAADPISGFAPLAVNFTCSVIGGDAPISYAWAFGDDTTSDEQNTTHTYRTTGPFTATCTARDEDGDAIHGSVDIAVAALPTNDAPVASFSWLPVVPETNESVTFNANASTDNDGSIVLYEWDFDGDGVWDATGVAVTIAYAAPGAYDVTLRVTDDNGAQDTETKEVAVVKPSALPVAEAGPDLTVYVNTLVKIDGSASYDPDGGDIVWYHWDFGNGEIAAGVHAQGSVVYNQLGTYTVTLTVTDDEDDTVDDTVVVTVIDEPYVAKCADGRDNDGDGLVDMADPGCSSPDDASEVNLVNSGPEKGLKVVSISSYSAEGAAVALPGDVLVVKTVLENVLRQPLEDLRIGFAVPELGVQQKSSQFDVQPGRRVTKQLLVYLPWDAALGEYYTEFTVANDELRRSLHRSLTIK
ncbi:PKD domain-containing protein [Candidatus Woesearchaeota archaeon]|nr:PKD domain-containing protein [Candidatus Woesearchaeota archaeon]